MLLTPRDVEIRHAHIFCGLGGGARGFNRGRATVGHLTGKFVCLGGIDNNAAALRDFERLSGAPGTKLDLFSYEQYTAFHGHQPPADWREATPDDVRVAFQNQHPHLLFLSAPCKGFSGLLSEKTSQSTKYQALNGLTLRGVWLALEAFQDDPIELIAFENVPRIRTRGRMLVDQILALLRSYGYAAVESEHDCGELGGLGQHRRRFLLMARHTAKVPPFLYEPPKRAIRGVGDVIGRLPVPGPHATLPMHRLPSLQWQTWVRLAFVAAGSDWRSLNKLRVAEGLLADYGLIPDREWHRGSLGVTDWIEPAGTVTSQARPHNGKFAVADPRIDGHAKSVQMGVGHWNQPAAVVKGDVSVGTGRYAIADPRYRAYGEHYGKMRVEDWDLPAHTITGSDRVGSGALSVADPRLSGKRFNHVYRIVPWSEPAPAVAGGGGPAGGLSVADPRARTEWAGKGKYIVSAFDEPTNTVIGASTTGNGAFAVADPRCTNYSPNAHRNKLRTIGWDETAATVTGGKHVQSGALSVADPRPAYARDGKDVYKTSGEYGVVPWENPSGAVTASAQHDNGRWAVADPRLPDSAPGAAPLPAATDRLVAVIQALDGTYHRPFTTLELAALQSLIDPDEILELDGASDAAHRERIGNAVPPDAAEAMASVMGTTLLLAWSGETFILSATPVWVRPLAIALSIHQPESYL